MEKLLADTNVIKETVETQKYRILVIDDEELNRVLLEDCLEDEYDVVTADNGLDALDMIYNDVDGFDGVLTDLKMPVMDGFDVLRELQESGFSERVPVAVITGETSPEIESKCLTAGAIDFIKKPFNFDVVRHRVKNVIHSFNYEYALEKQVARQTCILRKQNEQLEKYAAELHKRAEELDRVSQNIINLLGDLVEFRDNESGAHVKRVKRFTEILGRAYMRLYPEGGLTEQKLKLIADTSPLHDIGKIAVPDAVLTKPGKLTDEEFKCIQDHTVNGYDLLMKVKYGENSDTDYRHVCMEICRYHHERYDGHGYPDHLVGDQIPLSAQLVSVADVYDALVNERVYKAAVPCDEAVRMITNNECGVFNPKMMECLIASKDEMEENLHRLNKDYN